MLPKKSSNTSKETRSSVTVGTESGLKNRLVRQFRATPFLLPLIVIGVAVVLVFAYHSQNSTPGCNSVYKADGTIMSAKNYINVELAHTPAEKTKGLSGRNCIGPNQGMLFIFDQPGRYSFWMKDMLFPIDIVWADGNGQVLYVQHDVLPSSYPRQYDGPDDSRNVIEVGSGRADALGLTPGAQLRYNAHLSHLLE